MNFIEFINSKGVCKTASGHNISDVKINEEETKFPITGKIKWDNGHLMPMSWNREGNPVNLPYTHGLHLVGVVPKVNFEIIDIKKLP